MLKRKAYRKILITSLTFLILLLVSLMPNNNDNNIKTDITFDEVETGNIYLLNENNLLVVYKTIIDKNDDYINKIKNIIKSLTEKDKYPKGLSSLIPNNTKLLEVNIEDGIVYLNFSKEFLNINDTLIEKLVESISYSIFEIKEITGVSIYIENESINKYHSLIPIFITRDYGINKRYNLVSSNNIDKVITYFLTNINNVNYYVPITNYINNSNDKIKVIIENLKGNYTYEDNLISLIDSKLELINYEIKEDVMTLNFNNSIFNCDGKIIEEVIYTIGYSIIDNYNVNEVLFDVEGKNVEMFKKNM